MKIDIWSDIACPWCYIGLTRFERALAEFPQRDEVKVTVHSFQLDPSLPDSYPGTEAEYLSGRKGISVPEVEAMFEHVAAAAASEGLTMRFDTLAVANSRRAHRVLHAAAAADPSGATQRRLEDSLFRAHFTDGESIADPDVLVRLATTAGMNAAEAAAAVDDETRDAEVAAAMRALFTDTHNVAEGAGAAALAAAQQERSQLQGQHVGLALTGGNVDASAFAKVLAA